MTLNRLMDIQVGLHADVNDFSVAPVTYRRVQLFGGGETLMPRALTKIDRNDIMALDGRGFVGLYGPLDVADVAPVTEWKGVDANSGAAVASAGWAAKMEQADMITSMFGAAPAATVAAAPTVAASGHTATTITFTGTAPVAGLMYLFQTSAGPRIRQCLSAASQIATLAHPYTGTPTSSSTIIRAAQWEWSPAVSAHVHLGMLSEGPDYRAEFLGCAPNSLALAIPAGGRVTATWGYSPTDVAPLLSPAGPSAVYPPSGAPILGLNAELLIGAGIYAVDDLAVSYSNNNEARSTPASRNGRLGGIAGEKRGGFQITGSIRNEVIARGGVQRDTGVESLRTALGDTLGIGALSAERDVLLVVGRAAGAAFAVRLPTADFTASMAAVGSLAGIAFTATATRNATLGVF